MTGYLFVLVIIPLVFANVVEVFARYVLKSPTIWALDVTTMSYGALFMLGSALRGPRAPTCAPTCCGRSSRTERRA